MKIAGSVSIIFLLAFAGSAVAAPPPSIFERGRAISGTCFVKFEGAILMNGLCSGLGHGDSLFVTSNKDACSLSITRSGEAAISAYRGDCGSSDLGSDDEPIGILKRIGNCWVGANAKVCLKAGRRVLRNAKRPFAPW